MSEKVRCAACKFAQEDKKASEYSVKHCGKCWKWADCEVCRGCGYRDTCKARQSRSRKQSCDRRYDTVCGQQELRWAAYQCANPKSEYHRSLLNVSINGDMQTRITWSGCESGERKVSG